MYTARKNTISFSKCSEKMIFPKKWHWNGIFLVFSGNMIFLFPKNMMLFVRRKRKDDLSPKKKKIHENMLSSNVLKRWFFQNNLTGNMIFFVISGKMVILFQRKHDIFF